MTYFTKFITSLRDSVDHSIEFECVKKALEAKGLVVKTFRGLHIVSYSKRTLPGKPQPDFTDNLTRECRGLIFDKEFNIVCPGFFKFYDNDTDKCFMNESQRETFQAEIDLLTDSFEKILLNPETRVTYAIDSSLVRLYYNDNRWKLATTRSIDASKTRWNSYRTFFQLFDEAAKSQHFDWMDLPKENVYFLALVHPENRIVTPHTNPLLFHLTTFCKNDNGEWFEDRTSNIGVNGPINSDMTKNSDDVSRMNVEELLKSVEKLEWIHPGVVVEWKEDGCEVVKRTKIRNPAYEAVARLRGERRSMVERYLELKTDQDKQSEFQEFVKYYPEYKSVEYSIENLARFMHQTYLAFYVHHSIRYIPDICVWDMLQEIHTRFLRTHQKTTLNLVRQHINSLPFPRLAELLEPRRK